MNKHSAALPFSLLLLLLFIAPFINEANYYLFGLEFTGVFSFLLAIIYCIAYLFVIIQVPKFRLGILQLISIWLFYRLFYFFFLNSFTWFSASPDLGDGSTFHIPQALLITNPFDHLFAFSGNYNGRVTQVLLSFANSIVGFFGFDSSLSSIAKVSYLQNTIYLIFAAFILFFVNKRLSPGTSIPLYSCIILLFNPFVLSLSILPQKEAFLIFVFTSCLAIARLPFNFLSVFVLSILSLLCFLDRFYLLPILLLTYVLAYMSRNKKLFNFKTLIAFLIIFIIPLYIVFSVVNLSTLPILIGNLSTGHLDAAATNSFLPSSGLHWHVVRVVFGPFLVFRSLGNIFVENYVISFVLISSHLLFQFCVPFVLFRSFFVKDYYSSVYILTLSFFALTVPYVSAAKFLILISLLATNPSWSLRIFYPLRRIFQVS